MKKLNNVPKFYTKFFITFVLVLLSCSLKHEEWPVEIKGKVWIPENAIDLKYEKFKGSYQAFLKVKSCFPAKDIIDSMVQTMTTKKWERLKEDILNPGLKLSHVRNDLSWSSFYENEKYVLTWQEQWKDIDGNVVIYTLRYDPLYNYITSAECNLKIIAVYIPKELFKDQK